MLGYIGIEDITVCSFFKYDEHLDFNEFLMMSKLPLPLHCFFCHVVLADNESYQ